MKSSHCFESFDEAVAGFTETVASVTVVRCALLRVAVTVTALRGRPSPRKPRWTVHRHREPVRFRVVIRR